jgi:REP-associated tyrosine transposase
MVTTSTWERRDLFRNERWANLLIDTMYHYRGSAYLLHEFVIMPDHLHVILTPSTSLEKAVQFIKGGFSYRVKKELGSSLEIWQKGFSDHRIRDTSDYRIHAIYVRENPVRKHLCDGAKEYPFSSASRGFELDSPPQGLKPSEEGDVIGAPEGAPFQSKAAQSHAAQSHAAQSHAAQSHAAQSHAPQSKGGQSKDGQSHASQSKGAQSKGAQSNGAQSNGAQSNAPRGHAQPSRFRKASDADSAVEPLQPALKDFK